MSLKLFLAWRFIKDSRNRSSLSIVMLICFISIMISTGALILTAGIMRGFEKSTHEKLQGIHSDLSILSYNNALNFKLINRVLEKEFKDFIKASSPATYAQLIIRENQDTEQEKYSSSKLTEAKLIREDQDSKIAINSKQENIQNKLVLLKAIDPKTEPEVSNLSNLIILPKLNNTIKNSWSNLLDNNSIVIGQTLAQELGLSVNSQVELLYTQSEDNIHNNKISFDKYDAKVSAIFKTGIYEFDDNIIICSLDLFKKIFENLEIKEINIKLIDQTKSNLVKDKLIDRLGLDVKSWQDLYPALVSALALEKYAMNFVLTLVTIISAMNIVALIFMVMQQKKKQIAVLQSLGLSKSSVRDIFILISLIITGVAALTGLILALIVSKILTTYPIIKLPDVYYVSTLPIEISYSLIVKVLIGTLLLSLLAALIPIRSNLVKQKHNLLRE